MTSLWRNDVIVWPLNYIKLIALRNTTPFFVAILMSLICSNWVTLSEFLIAHFVLFLNIIPPWGGGGNGGRAFEARANFE